MPVKQKKEEETESIHASLKKLEDIAAWFQSSRDFDIEEGLKKVREGAGLVKTLKARLSAVENEFVEIQKDLRPLHEEE